MYSPNGHQIIGSSTMVTTVVMHQFLDFYNSAVYTIQELFNL